jgi:hypothetical protein
MCSSMVRDFLFFESPIRHLYSLLHPNNSCELVLDSRGPKNMATLQFFLFQHNAISERRRWWDLLPGFLQSTKVLHHLTWGIFLHRDLSHTQLYSSLKGLSASSSILRQTKMGTLIGVHRQHFQQKRRRY